LLKLLEVHTQQSESKFDNMLDVQEAVLDAKSMLLL
jgi:hypothetical protein